MISKKYCKLLNEINKEYLKSVENIYYENIINNIPFRKDKYLKKQHRINDLVSYKYLEIRNTYVLDGKKAIMKNGIVTNDIIKVLMLTSVGQEILEDHKRYNSLRARYLFTTGIAIVALLLAVYNYIQNIILSI